MPKAPKSTKNKGSSKGVGLRHNPLEKDVTRPNGKLRAPKVGSYTDGDEDELEEVNEEYMNHDDGDGDGDGMLSGIRAETVWRAGADTTEVLLSSGSLGVPTRSSMDKEEDIHDDDNDDDEDDEVEIDDEIVEMDDGYIGGLGLSTSEEAVVQNFLNNDGGASTQTLADIIMQKIQARSATQPIVEESSNLPPKVIQVYTAVGQILKHYTSGLSYVLYCIVLYCTDLIF
jgi:essential nuclear protein 1